MARKRHALGQRSLIVEITLPTVAVVLLVTLVSAHLLGEVFARTHEEHAEERVRRFADEIDATLAVDYGPDHRELDHILPAIAAASGKASFLTRPDGQVRHASSPELLEARLAMPAPERQELERHGARYVRYVRPVANGPRCTGCHVGAGPLGYLAVDSPRDAAEQEVTDQKRSNLVAGGILAVVLSVVLVSTQVFLLHRPIRRLTRTVERIRAGDLHARTTIDRADEIGTLARTLDEMAEALEKAKSELDRTHRAELAQSEKLASLGQLTSSIAHEIKNPLSGIIGALRVLEAQTKAEDPSKQILQKILAQAERLSKTAVELLEFARPLKPAFQTVDVCDLLDRSVFFVERQAAEQSVELRRRYERDLPPVVVDPDLVKQVFLNVVLNGVQAMPGGGTLGLDVRQGDGGSVEVTVSDQGAGIPPENLGRIFSPFFSTKPRGTGLGLYVARQLVETQRGELRVESHVGQGTSFTIRLPTRPAEGLEEQSHAAS